jgi:hypothetical protein
MADIEKPKRGGLLNRIRGRKPEAQSTTTPEPASTGQTVEEVAGRFGAESPEALAEAQAAAEMVEAANSGESGPEALRKIEKIAEGVGAKVETGNLPDLLNKAENLRGGKPMSEAEISRVAQRVRELETGREYVPSSKKIDTAAHLFVEMTRSIDNIKITRPVRGYSKKWLIRPAGEYVITTLDMGATSAGFGLLISSLFGVHIELFTPQHAALYAATYLAIGRPNISTKKEVLDWLAGGAKINELNPFKHGAVEGLKNITKYAGRGTALALALSIAAGTIPEVIKVMNESQKSATILRAPTDKFLEGIEKNRSNLGKFGPAIRAIIDFAVDMEQGKATGIGTYVKWSDVELKQKRDALASVLKEAGFNDAEIKQAQSISGSPNVGYGEQAQFRDVLLTGKSRGPAKVVSGARSPEAALQARRDAGIQENEQLGDAVVRIIDEFLNDKKIKEVTDMGKRVQYVADKIESHGRNPLLVAWNTFVLGAPPTDIHEIESLVKEIEKRRGEIKKQSEEQVGKRLQDMFGRLNRAIVTAQLGGQLNLKAPGAFDIDTSALDILRKLMDETIPRAQTEAADEAERSMKDSVIQGFWKGAERFTITAEKRAAMGEFAGRNVGQVWEAPVRDYGGYISWAISLVLCFSIVLGTSIPAYRRGKEMREGDEETGEEGEEKLREKLFVDEQSIVSRLTRTLNDHLGKIPGMPTVTDAMMRVAIRALRDEKNPRLHPARSVLGTYLDTIKSTTDRGPVPEMAMNQVALQKTLRDLQTDSRMSERLVEIMIPGGLKYVEKHFEAEALKARGKGGKKLDKILTEQGRMALRMELSHQIFRERVFKAQMDELNAMGREFQAEVLQELDAGQRKSLDEIMQKPIHINDHEPFKEFVPPVANFLRSRAVIDDEWEKIRKELESARNNIKRLKEQSIEAHPGDPTKSITVYEFPEEGGPYSSRNAAALEIRRAVNDRVGMKTHSSEPHLQLDAVTTAFRNVTQEFLKTYPNFSVDMKYIYNPATWRMEFRLEVVDSTTGRRIFEDKLGDNLLTPDHTAQNAGARMTAWLNSRYRSLIPEQIFTDRFARDILSKSKPLDTPRIPLTGSSADRLRINANKVLDTYYEDFIANMMAELGKLIKGRMAKIRLLPDYENEVEKLKQSAIQHLGVALRPRANDIVENVLTSAIIPSKVDVFYDLRTHEILIEKKLGFLSRGVKSERIPAHHFNAQAFEKALTSVAA